MMIAAAGRARVLPRTAASDDDCSCGKSGRATAYCGQAAALCDSEAVMDGGQAQRLKAFITLCTHLQRIISALEIEVAVIPSVKVSCRGPLCCCLALPACKDLHPIITQENRGAGSHLEALCSRLRPTYHQHHLAQTSFNCPDDQSIYWRLCCCAAGFILPTANTTLARRVSNNILVGLWLCTRLRPTYRQHHLAQTSFNCPDDQSIYWRLCCCAAGFILPTANTTLARRVSNNILVGLWLCTRLRPTYRQHHLAQTSFNCPDDQSIYWRLCCCAAGFILPTANTTLARRVSNNILVGLWLCTRLRPTYRQHHLGQTSLNCPDDQLIYWRVCCCAAGFILPTDNTTLARRVSTVRMINQYIGGSVVVQQASSHLPPTPPWSDESQLFGRSIRIMRKKFDCWPTYCVIYSAICCGNIRHNYSRPPVLHVFR
ncbi:hypothetical protein J6590_003174 [Homalodisca vitripennis]|nr:hypothetical protein J6590_003174 [Homalodisca vitripennis]